MFIGLDARTIYQPNRRGTGKNLIDLYTRLAAVRPHWRVIAYHRQPGQVDELLPSPNIQPKLIEMVGDRFDAWQQWRLPVAARRDHLDVLHCPANLCPQWMPTKTIVTIHDLIPLDFPDNRPATQVRRFERAVRRACKSAAGIICPSSYTRDRLVRQFNADPRRITVNAWAPDSSVQPIPQHRWAPVLDSYGITKPFVLHFGAADPRKNTRRMIEAWAACNPIHRRRWQLLIVGLDHKTRQELSNTVTQLSLQSSVRLHGFADEAHLPTLLSASELVAYPSLSEGFGLPILDAWAAGTTILTSDCTSLTEVADDAAILVDPLDALSIARGLNRLMRDARLRSELIYKGRNRLKRYSWRATTERFAAALERAAGITTSLRAAA